jgi:hypothetical protein
VSLNTRYDPAMLAWLTFASAKPTAVFQGPRAAQGWL